MRRYLIVLVLVLFGCATSPSMIVNIPTAPTELMAEPAMLKKLPTENLVLSNFADSVVDNYAVANQIRNQLTSLQSWVRQVTTLGDKKQ